MKYYYLLLLLLIIGCESPIDNKLKLINNSENDIFIRKSTTTRNEIDSLINNVNPDKWIDWGIFMQPGDTFNFVSLGSWESIINSETDKQLHFFIFDAQKFLKYREGILDKSKLKYKQLDFTLEDLQRLNWTIVYKSDSL